MFDVDGTTSSQSISSSLSAPLRCTWSSIGELIVANCFRGSQSSVNGLEGLEARAGAIWTGSSSTNNLHPSVNILFEQNPGEDREKNEKLHEYVLERKIESLGQMTPSETR